MDAGQLNPNVHLCLDPLCKDDAELRELGTLCPLTVSPSEQREAPYECERDEEHCTVSLCPGRSRVLTCPSTSSLGHGGCAV